MTLTPEQERKAEYYANALKKALGPKPERRNPYQPNIARPQPGCVVINMAAYEAQLRDRAVDRAYRRWIDPYGLGLYGPLDDE